MMVHHLFHITIPYLTVHFPCVNAIATAAEEAQGQEYPEKSIARRQRSCRIEARPMLGEGRLECSLGKGLVGCSTGQ